MKPFLCDLCGLPGDIRNMEVRWNFDREKKAVKDFKIFHSGLHPETAEMKKYMNRKLQLEFIFANMPEFLSYIGRFSFEKRELKKFVHIIEKDRSYIRRHHADKKEVKKLILLLDGFGD